nr:MAG TPA: hypothetical protein [Siphoviridae sp. ctD5s5]
MMACNSSGVFCFSIIPASSSIFLYSSAFF